MKTANSYFAAPWSTALKVTTAIAVAMLAGLGVLFATGFPRDLLGGVPFLLTMLCAFATILGSALFIVRGYEVGPGGLRMRRLLWSTELSLAELQAAWSDPTAMAKSLRLFGNGGLFVFAGLFWNRSLGRYRAFATHPRNAVVLRFESRTVVVTPEFPGAFLEALAHSCPQADVRLTGA